MVNVFVGLWLLLIILIAAAFLAYYFFPAAFPVFRRHAHVPNQGVIKRDWVATGRIDFATSITKVTSNPGDHDQPLNSSCSWKSVGLWRASREMKICRCNGGLLRGGKQKPWSRSTTNISQTTRSSKLYSTRHHRCSHQGRLLMTILRGTNLLTQTWPTTSLLATIGVRQFSAAT